MRIWRVSHTEYNRKDVYEEFFKHEGAADNYVLKLSKDAALYAYKSINDIRMEEIEVAE